MSETESTSGAGERSESFFGVFFALMSLALVFAVGIAVVGLRVQGGDSRSLYDELFAPGDELPFDLQFAGGTAVANKQRWVRLERDPAAIVEGDGLPSVALIGRFAGPIPVARQFETGNLPAGKRLAEERDKWLEESGDKWLGLMNQGVVTWDVWEANFVHLRQFLGDGTFYDLIRVNLSSGPQGQILVAHWPFGDESADVDTLRDILSVLSLEAGQQPEE